MTAATLKLNVDLIGSKEVAKEAAGHARIHSQCTEMKRFLKDALDDLNSAGSIQIALLAPEGDDIGYEFTCAPLQSQADVAVAVVKRAFLDCPLGRSFRYVIFTKEPEILYQPALKEFSGISKTTKGKRHHICIERRVVHTLSEGEDATWLNDAPRDEFKLTFKSEYRTGVWIHVYFPLSIEKASPTFDGKNIANLDRTRSPATPLVLDSHNRSLPDGLARLKPYQIAGCSAPLVHLMYGNHTSPIEVAVNYTHEPLEIPPEVQPYYGQLSGQAERKATESGAAYFDGPIARLTRFTERNARPGPTGEIKGITLELGPLSWVQFNVLHTFLDSIKLGDNRTIRETLCDNERVFEHDRDFRWCKLGNFLVVPVTPITVDGFAIIQERSSRGVSIDGGKFTTGISENIHRYLDEASGDDLWSRMHPLTSPVEVHRTGDADSTYRPKGVPSPMLTAERGLVEEISSKLADSIRDRKRAYQFLNVGFDMNGFHPVLVGIIELGLTLREVKEVVKESPGKDHSEYSRLHYPKLDPGVEETSLLLRSVERWVPNGLAGFISALHFWAAKSGT